MFKLFLIYLNYVKHLVADKTQRGILGIKANLELDFQTGFCCLDGLIFCIATFNQS